ncbi:MAG: ThuA domain-containing protein [Phycisphaeraceae bacterium]|nr:ThuA domain-containing protein [Phycisphaeraceae bacterium]
MRFTQPIHADWLAKPDHYAVQQWTYEATQKYGGEKKNLEDLKVKTAIPASDGMSVVLAIDGLKPSRLVHFLLNPKSVDGEEIWSAEAWYTLKRLPAGSSGKPTHQKHVVFVTGDDEYGSEVSMPMIASILEQKPGFRVTVLKAVDDKGQWSRAGQSIPGLRALREADAAVFFMRFRALPDQQVKEIEDYVASGRPVLGLRTSTHAFNYKNGPYRRLNDGFGQDIFGQKWISHYGHGSTSQALLENDAQAHSILRGLPHEFDLHSWLYVMNSDETRISEDCEVLISGRAMREVEGEKQIFGDIQPVAWTRQRVLAGGKPQRVFYTSLGHPRDFLDLPSRRLMLNAIYWAVGLESEIPAEGVDAPMPEGYAPEDPK